MKTITLFCKGCGVQLVWASELLMKDNRQVFKCPDCNTMFTFDNEESISKSKGVKK